LKQAKPFYKSRKWRRTRELILKRDKYQCQEAKRFGQYEEATTVHHIYQLEEYPALAYKEWNLISVSCNRHDKLHDRKSGGVTEAGKNWQKKRERKFEEWKRGTPPIV